MFSAIRRWWSHLRARLVRAFSSKADPRVQLDQAIDAARAAHVQLKDHVVNVVANQKQADLELRGSLADRARATDEARAALVAADEAARAGDHDSAARHTATAEARAADLVRLDGEIEGREATLLEATAAADRAREALATSAARLQEQLAERSRLAGKLDEIDMQEQLEATMRQLEGTPGGDTPTLAEVRERIDQQHAEVKARAELADTSVDRRIAELEAAVAGDAARSRLGELRDELGLEAPGRTAGRPAQSPEDA